MLRLMRDGERPRAPDLRLRARGPLPTAWPAPRNREVRSCILSLATDAGVAGDGKAVQHRQPVGGQHADGPVSFAVSQKGGGAVGRVAVLGTGLMGGPMARNLLRSG